MVQKLNFLEIKHIYGGAAEVDCGCLDVNRNIVSTQKAKDKNDCWKICCKDGVPHVYAQYGEFGGACMLEKDYIDFLKMKAEKKSSHGIDGL